MADYSSGEFHPYDSGSTGNPGSAVSYNGEMYFFNSGSNGSVYMAYCTTPDGDVSADDSWFNLQLPKDSIGARVVSQYPTATVVARGYVYVFWVDSDWEYVACTRMDPARNFSEYAVVQDKNGNNVGNRSSAIAATVITGKKVSGGAVVDLDFIVLSLVDSDANTLSYLVFDADNFVTGDVFKASHSQSVPASSLTGRLREQDITLLPYSSIAYYSQGAGTESNGDTQNYILQSLVLLHKNDDKWLLQRGTLSLQLDGVCQPVWGDFSRGWLMDETAYVPYNPTSPKPGSALAPWNVHGLALRRDPGGRIKAYWRDYTSGELQYRIFDTNQPSSGPVWQAPQGLPQRALSAFGPAVEFSLGGPLDNGNGYEAREWVFYTEYVAIPTYTRDVECQVAYSGKLLKVVDAEVLSLTEISNSDNGGNGSGVAGGYRMLRGYIDGPVPLPNINVVADSTKVTNAGCINYGESKSDAVSHTVSQQWTVGMKSSGSTQTGFGPAWEMSIGGGEAKTWGDTSYTSTSSALQQNIGVLDDKVLKKGTAFLSDIVLHRDEFQFIPAGETTPTTQAPSFSYIWAEFPRIDARSYDVYTTTPGDLESYTRESWDARMKDAGYGSDYFKNVIEANALDLDPDQYTVQKSLNYSWTSNGGVLAKAAWATSAFTDSAWTFETSFYAGFSFGFFGVAQGQALAGATFNYENSTRTESGSAWEVEANFTCPTSLDIGAVSYYDFSLWVLPADQRWTQEFLDLCTNKDLTDVIDPNSKAWKIVCLVERYGTISELSALTKHGLSPERVAKLREAGIKTTGHLARKLRAHRPEDLDGMIQRGHYGLEDLEAAHALRAYMADNEYVDPERRKLYPRLEPPKPVLTFDGPPRAPAPARTHAPEAASGTA